MSQFDFIIAELKYFFEFLFLLKMIVHSEFGHCSVFTVDYLFSKSYCASFTVQNFDSLQYLPNFIIIFLCILNYY